MDNQDTVLIYDKGDLVEYCGVCGQKIKGD